MIQQTIKTIIYSKDFNNTLCYIFVVLVKCIHTQISCHLSFLCFSVVFVSHTHTHIHQALPNGTFIQFTHLLFLLYSCVHKYWIVLDLYQDFLFCYYMIDLLVDENTTTVVTDATEIEMWYSSRNESNRFWFETWSQRWFSRSFK